MYVGHNQVLLVKGNYLKMSKNKPLQDVLVRIVALLKWISILWEYVIAHCYIEKIILENKCRNYIATPGKTDKKP